MEKYTDFVYLKDFYIAKWLFTRKKSASVHPRTGIDKFAVWLGIASPDLVSSLPRPRSRISLRRTLVSLRHGEDVDFPREFVPDFPRNFRVLRVKRLLHDFRGDLCSLGFCNSDRKRQLLCHQSSLFFAKLDCEIRKIIRHLRNQSRFAEFCENFGSPTGAH